MAKRAVIITALFIVLSAFVAGGLQQTGQATVVAQRTTVEQTGAATIVSVTAKSLGSSNSLTTNYGEQIVPGAGNKFVKYAMYFQNINAPNTDLGNPYYVTLRDTQGNAHSCDSNTFYIQSQKVNGTTLQGLSGVQNSQPGDKHAGIIVFQIPQSATPKSLTYNDHTNNITINL